MTYWDLRQWIESRVPVQILVALVAIAAIIAITDRVKKNARQ